MKLILETGRLKLREFSFADTQFIIELLNSPGWLRFIGDRNVKSEEQAKHYIQHRIVKFYLEFGYGFYQVVKKEGEIPIGMCGIVNRDHLDCPEIGFAFLPEYMGCGYAYEIAKPTLEYATTTLNIKRIGAITIPGNDRSIKLLEKIGLKYKETITKNGEEFLVFSN
ncbi:MAG TPA: GNAT family N-acetyltransferase [Anditalea sp.]|nr:GNAT family N-acetyltransferase [Anditalea sp.]